MQHSEDLIYHLRDSITNIEFENNKYRDLIKEACHDIEEYDAQIKSNEAEKQAVKASIEEYKAKANLFRQLTEKNLENIKNAQWTNQLTDKNLTALKELDMQLKAQSNAKLNKQRKILAENKERFNQSLSAMTKNPAIIEMIDEVKSLRARVESARVNQQLKRNQRLKKDNQLKKILWDKTVQDIIDIAKKAVQIKNQQRLLNELKQEREQREQKEKQRQQQLELELKSKRKHAEETVSPYFKVPSVPTFLPNVSSITLEKQPMNQLRNNLQGPQQQQQVTAKPADKSMGLKLPTFDFGVLNAHLNRINESTIYNTKVTTQTFSIQRADELDSPPKLIEQQDITEFSISQKSDNRNNDMQLTSTSFNMFNFPSLKTKTSQSNEFKSASFSMDQSMGMDESMTEQLLANTNMQEDKEPKGLADFMFASALDETSSQQPSDLDFMEFMNKTDDDYPQINSGLSFFKN